METEHRINGKADEINIDPFAQTLATLARESGFSTQTALAQALGLKNSRAVSNWYKGVNVPTAEYISILLTTLTLNQSQIDDLVDKWGVHLQNGKGYRGRQSGTEGDFRRSQSRRETETDLPLSQWILTITQSRGLTLRKLAEMLGLHPSTLNSSRERGFSPSVISSILREVAALNLTPEERINLTNSISQTN